MKTEIKKELILTLNGTEIEKLREQLSQLPLWSYGEMKDQYKNTPIAELWCALKK